MHTIKDIDTLLKSHGNPSPSLLMPLVLHAPEQEVRTEAAVRMAKMMATKRTPNLGVRHLWRMAMREGQRKSTMVTCLLAILAHKELKYLGSATSIFQKLDASDKMDVLKRISLDGDALVVNFLVEIIGNAGFDSGDKDADGDVGFLAQDLTHKIAGFGDLVDEVSGFEDMVYDPDDWEGYDPHDLGVPMPKQTEHLCDCVPMFGGKPYPLFRIFDGREPISEDNPLILMGYEVHIKYDGKVLERSKIEWSDVDPDDADEENPADIYIHPGNYSGVYEGGSLSKDFMKRNPGHLSLFLQGLMDEIHEDVVLDAFVSADPDLASVVEWIRWDSNLNERKLEVFDRENIGVIDSWSHNLEFMVGDFGKVMLRVTESYIDELAMILEEEDMLADGGQLTSSGKVIMGEIRDIGDMDSFRKAATQLLLEHTDLEIDEIDWSKIDTSQVEQILDMLAG